MSHFLNLSGGYQLPDCYFSVAQDERNSRYGEILVQQTHSWNQRLRAAASSEGGVPSPIGSTSGSFPSSQKRLRVPREHVTA